MKEICEGFGFALASFTLLYITYNTDGGDGHLRLWQPNPCEPGSNSGASGVKDVQIWRTKGADQPQVKRETKWADMIPKLYGESQTYPIW